MSLRVAIVTTHPIQYQVPWFRALATKSELDLTVFYGQIPNAASQGDGFGVSFQWDIPLLDGYHYEVLPNIAKVPSVTAFGGCDTPTIAERLRDNAFDAVIVNGWVSKMCLQTLVACRRLRIPCIVRGESNTLRRRSWWKRLLHRQLLRQYSAFLVIGKSNAEFYTSHGVAREKLFPGLYCIDNDRFSETCAVLRPQQSAIRAGFQTAADVPVFLYCGKFVAKKHPMTLLRSAVIARDQGSKLHVLLVGDGILRQECEQFAREQRLSCSFTGFLNQSRLPEAYVAADCLVLPSDDGETWGLVVNEAMACGLPAIVSDRVGCGPDLIIPGQTGAVFPFGDERHLARTLRELSANRQKLRSMGTSARHHVGAYSINALAAGTFDAVRAVTRYRRNRSSREARHHA